MNCALYNCLKSLRKVTLGRADRPAYSIWLLAHMHRALHCNTVTRLGTKTRYERTSDLFILILSISDAKVCTLD